MKKIWNIIIWLIKQRKGYTRIIITITVLGIFLSLCRVAMAMLTKGLIDAAVDRVWQNAVRAGAVFGIAIILQVTLKGAISLMTVNTAESMSNGIREELYILLTRVKWGEYAKYHSGDIVTRVTSDVGIVVNGIVQEIPEIISLGVGLIASFLALLLFEPILALSALLMGPLVVAFGLLFSKKFMKIHEKNQEAESAYRSYIQECLEHMLVLKAFCHEKESAGKVHRLQAAKKNQAVLKNQVSVIAGSLVTIAFYLCYLIAFGWGAVGLFKGTITFGTLTAFLQLIAQIQIPFLGLSGTLPQVVAMAGSAKRLIELEKLEKEAFCTDRAEGNVNCITLEGVGFEYKEHNPVLKNISNQIQAGEIIGLTGKSGEGKTTLIYLLMGLMEPVTGRIGFHFSRQNFSLQEPPALYSPGRENNGLLRAYVSYVPQGNTLFSGTIFDNLVLGCPKASEKEMADVLKLVQIWGFIEKLPQGLYTQIGERGIGISEGQAQRIAIARALLHKAPVLLLDEATSALDEETEREILKAITGLKPKRICIIITHRPSILDYCSRIWKLTDGELIERADLVNEVPAIEAI